MEVVRIILGRGVGGVGVDIDNRSQLLTLRYAFAMPTPWRVGAAAAVGASTSTASKGRPSVAPQIAQYSKAKRASDAAEVASRDVSLSLALLLLLSSVSDLWQLGSLAQSSMQRADLDLTRMHSLSIRLRHWLQDEQGSERGLMSTRYVTSLSLFLVAPTAFWTSDTGLTAAVAASWPCVVCGGSWHPERPPDDSN